MTWPSLEPTALFLDVPALWQHVREVRERVARHMVSCSEELREGTLMTASELVENAIKYSENVAGAQAIQFALTITESHVRMVVSNGVASRASIEGLVERFEQIARTGDREQLYMGRLHEMLEGPRSHGKLGLYRIGFEGKFDLEWAYADQRLTVTATRAI